MGRAGSTDLNADPESDTYQCDFIACLCFKHVIILPNLITYSATELKQIHIVNLASRYSALHQLIAGIITPRASNVR